MAGEFDLVFNSGSLNEDRYTEGDNVSLIEVTDSDQDYYQNGQVILYDEIALQSVGAPVKVIIDNTLQFDGYVARRQQSIDHGVKYTTYQLVGRTYDLWRHSTPSELIYQDCKTAFIADHLVSNYVTGVSGNDITITDGSTIDEIDLSNTIVGDAIAQLIGYDGYKFYVDTDGELQYYTTAGTSKSFTIEEGDIIQMSPIEEADEDIVNDVLVVGGSGYSSKTQQTLNDDSTYFPSGVLVAQSFVAENHTLSAVDFYLDRSYEPNQPGTLNFEIWGGSAPVLLNTEFDTYSGFDEDTNTGLSIDTGDLTTSTSYTEYGILYGTIDRVVYGHANAFKPTAPFKVDKVYSILFIHDPSNYIVTRFMKPADNDKPDENNQVGPTKTQNWAETLETDFSADNVWLESGQIYWVTQVNDVDKSVSYTMPYGQASNEGYWKTAYVGTQGGGWQLDAYSNYHRMMVYGYQLNKPTGSIMSDSHEKDCQYIKVVLDGVVSSNNVLISGTNTSNWESSQKLTPGEWYDFGYEKSDGARIKVFISGNYSYGPRIGGLTMSISDADGKFESEIFNDSFTDDTCISTSSYDNTALLDGNLQLSGAIGTDQEWITANLGKYDTASTEYTKAPWDKLSYTCDDNSSTYGAKLIVNSTGIHNFYLIYSSQNIADGDDADYNYIDGVRIFLSDVNGELYMRMREIKVSGPTYSDGWETAYESAYGENTESVNNWTSFSTHQYDLNAKYSNVKKIRIWYEAYTSFGDSNLYHNKTEYRTVPKYTSSGSIKSKKYDTGLTMSFLEIIPSDVTYPDDITYSGSCNGGSNWTKLTPHQNTTINETGTEVVLAYYFKPSGGIVIPDISSSSIKPGSPQIGSLILNASQIQSGGQPKSGSHSDGGKIEHSDDISFSYGSADYPPQWTGWKAYGGSKLSGLSIGSKYWIVMYHNSANSKWWKYHYDEDSEYTDGKIMYTWYGPNFKVKWSSNSQDPTHVPAGSMAFKLGWTEGSITATSSNSESISNYGRHFKRIQDSTITTQAAADLRASLEVSGSKTPTKKGSLTIDGRTDMSVEYKFATDLANFDISTTHDIVSYTQRIDHTGFSTTINYGKQPFDIVKELAVLKKEVL